MNYFKQYGELRTGTNYLKRLIELNFKDSIIFGSILGWKHGTYGLTNCEDDTKIEEVSKTKRIPLNILRLIFII